MRACLQLFFCVLLATQPMSAVLADVADALPAAAHCVDMDMNMPCCDADASCGQSACPMDPCGPAAAYALVLPAASLALHRSAGADRLSLTTGPPPAGQFLPLLRPPISR